MLNGKKILGIIPARAGSKRVEHKNLTLFKVGNSLDSLLGHATKQALRCKYIDHVVISSDLAPLYHDGPNDNPQWLRRPEYLAGDRTPMEAVLVHAVRGCDAHDFGVLLQPTSPLRSDEDIRKCIEIAVTQHGKNDLTGCVSYNPYGKRNGAVYVFHCLHFLEFLSLDAAHHYEMPMERSLDIDYAWQFPPIGGDDANTDSKR